MNIVRATFHQTYANYVAGDVAGIRREIAEGLRARRILSFEDLAPALDLDALDRVGLVALARHHLGVDDEPPAEVADEALRAALRRAFGGPGAPNPLPGEGAPGWDRLDAMDRAHLEAFARDKVRMTEIDAEMDDAELRRQIRAAAEATLSAGAAAPAGAGGAKRRRP